MSDSISAVSPDNPKYSFADDWAEYKKLQAAFMVNPPPCGESVEFRICNDEDGLVGSTYIFDASDVQSVAEKMIKHDPQMTGLRGAAKWTSLSDPHTPSPTPVPEMLVTTFKEISFELVIAGKGLVTCPQCKKQYKATDLKEGDLMNGGHFSKAFYCPIKHKLIRRVEMHILFKDNR